MDIQQPGISSATTTSPYTLAPPSPPFIHVPLRAREAITLKPSTTNIASMDISSDQLRIITQGFQRETASDGSSKWAYEQRRQAQRILDFLFLGPFSVARDQKYLEEQGITMVMPVRYAPEGTNLKNPLVMFGTTGATRALGIPVEPVDVTDDSQLVRVFPEAVRKINSHVLGRAAEHGSKVPSTAGKLHDAKVLVICETGNERSALVVAGYLMAMYGLDLIDSLSFLSMRRFSVSYNEDLKRHLQTWGALIKARKDVALSTKGPVHHKRTISDTYDDHAMEDAQNTSATDLDDESRFGTRDFVPFVDRRNSLDNPL